ncbi:hypothetical protein MTR_3g077710 [Medicago truncatula]|uniref:Uncharacterized protein n=1 Tax=Medicago truncatula TaxID=3880 RepID=G7J5F1_MEDTR|nr:hypothetical protein MTR_3g077710 [Medicago truncatula]
MVTEQDMAAHSVIWQGRVLNSQFNDQELRNHECCPLTPEEFGLLLAAFTDQDRGGGDGGCGDGCEGERKREREGKGKKDDRG